MGNNKKKTKFLLLEIKNQKKMIGNFFAAVAFSAVYVDAHGYLKVPAARNWARSIKEHETYEPQSLPAGGPGSVFGGGGYEHGMCGDSKSSGDQKWNIPGEIQKTYYAGDSIEMSAVITAHTWVFLKLNYVTSKTFLKNAFTRIV